jgi:[acyl-carrier-protein] S-malonyltransferase
MPFYPTVWKEVSVLERIALLFPGQGSQYSGMAKNLYKQYEIVRRTFEEAGDTLGFNLVQLCFEGSPADLGKTQNALAALLTVGVSYFRVYMSEIGVKPLFTAGHSLGEYSALTCGGAIAFADALRIVDTRSKIAQDGARRVNGAMTIIDGLDANRVAEACQQISNDEHYAAISCDNSARQVAISGHLPAVEKVEDQVLKLGGTITPLVDNPPFHSPVMTPAAGQFKAELQQYSFHPLRYPVIANVTAAPYSGPEQMGDLLTQHMIRPVQWRSIMEYLHKYRITMAVELGPKNVLTALLEQSDAEIKALSFDRIDDRRALIDYFTNNPAYQNHIPTVVTKCLAIAAATPNHNPNSEEYIGGVVEPFRKLRMIQNEIENQGNKPGAEEMRTALKLLRRILNAKKVALGKQQEWYDEILAETGSCYRFRDEKFLYG